MFSNDRNIETIGQLVKLAKHYIGLQKEYMKLDIIEKAVKLITALLLFILLSLILIAISIYLSFALAFAIAPSVGYTCAFGIIAAIYAVIFILFFIFRKKWIEGPLVKFIAGLLME